MEKSIETFCDFPLFEYSAWDLVDTDMFHFYSVQWKLSSMQKFNNLDVARCFNGNLEIFNSEGMNSFSIKIIDIPEVRNMILSRIPDEMPEDWN